MPDSRYPVSHSGAELADASAVVVLIHGRGASAESMLQLAGEFAVDGVAYLALQAPGHTWYPHSFLAAIDTNEPGISDGIAAVKDLVDGLPVPRSKVVVLGFSQGACLALEFAARHTARYGGIVAWSGGLIGTGPAAEGLWPDDKTFDYSGSMDGTPVFLGCSDIDPHIPLARVRKSTEVFRSLGATVDERIYPGMGHTVNAQEVDVVEMLLRDLMSAP